MRKLFIITLCIFTYGAVAQKTGPKEYIEKYAKIAQQEMQRSGVPAAITLAQGILESESGNSDLAVRGNNHFGIKCKRNWSGGSIYHDDDAKQECFRRYESAEQSYMDHSDFLKNNPRYATLFSLEVSDYKGWAKGLKKAGYATNPAYAQKLIDLIEKYELQQFNSFESEMENPALANEQTGSTTRSISMVEQTKELSTPSNDEVIREYNTVYYINETKAIQVSAGTSLLAIANQHNLLLDRILEFNDLAKNTSDILENDALVFLQRKRKQGSIEQHKVEANETLHQIAQKEGIRLEMLLLYNNLTPTQQPAFGEVLYLKTKRSNTPKLKSKF